MPPNEPLLKCRLANGSCFRDARSIILSQIFLADNVIFTGDVPKPVCGENYNNVTA